MVNLNISHEIYWSVFIIHYFLLKGISAGIFLIIALSELTENEKLREFTPLGLWTVLGSSFLFPLFLIADLSQPSRFVEILIQPQFGSPTAWGGYFITLYGILAVLLCYFYFRKDAATAYYDAVEKGSGSATLFKILALNKLDISDASIQTDKRVTKILFAIGIPLAMALEFYAAIVLGKNNSRALWNSPILPLLFLTSAIMTGAAALLVLYYVGMKFVVRKPLNMEAVKQLGIFMIAGILGEAILALIYFLYLPNTTEGAETALNTIFFGKDLPTFIVVDLLIGLLIPLILLSVKQTRENIWANLLAGVGILIGAYSFKGTLILGGQEVPRTGSTLLEFKPDFTNEISPLIGAYLGLLLIVLVIFWFLPWQPRELTMSKKGAEQA